MNMLHRQSTLRIWLPFILLAPAVPFLTGCEEEYLLNGEGPDHTPLFGERTDLGAVERSAIREASGLAASRRNHNVLWTHNDSGDMNRVFALNTRGEHLGIYTIEGVQARDWEDIAVGPGPDPDEEYLYIGDIGDNSRQFELKYIYRVPEPVVDENQAPIDTLLNDAVTITLQFPFGRSDAETLMLDPLTGDIYLVTKGNSPVIVLRAPAPLSTTDEILMEPVTTLTLAHVSGTPSSGQGAVGGDISPSGLEVLIKTYNRVYYWHRASGESSFFGNSPVVLPYTREPQGEAIAWADDAGGYFTVSEEALGIQARLYFYARLSRP